MALHFLSCLSPRPAPSLFDVHGLLGHCGAKPAEVGVDAHSPRVEPISIRAGHRISLHLPIAVPVASLLQQGEHWGLQVDHQSAATQPCGVLGRTWTMIRIDPSFIRCESCRTAKYIGASMFSARAKATPWNLTRSQCGAPWIPCHCHRNCRRISRIKPGGTRTFSQSSSPGTKSTCASLYMAALLKESRQNRRL